MKNRVGVPVVASQLKQRASSQSRVVLVRIRPSLASLMRSTYTTLASSVVVAVPETTATVNDLRVQLPRSEASRHASLIHASKSSSVQPYGSTVSSIRLRAAARRSDRFMACAHRQRCFSRWRWRDCHDWHFFHVVALSKGGSPDINPASSRLDQPPFHQ